MDFWNWSLKGWRTIIINAAMAVMPILEMTELTAVMPPHWLPYYALAMAIVNMWLRSITTSEMGKRA